MRKRNMMSRGISFMLTLSLVFSGVGGLSSGNTVYASEIGEGTEAVTDNAAKSEENSMAATEETATEETETQQTETQETVTQETETQETETVETETQEAETQQTETQGMEAETNVGRDEDHIADSAEADAEFTKFLETIYADIPEGQEKVSYENNYQTGQEEPFTYKAGTGMATVNNGLTMRIDTLTANNFVATWDNTPYLSSGVLTTNFKYQSDSERIGFLIKSNDNLKGIAIKYDITSGDVGKWVLQSVENGDVYDSFDGPALEQDVSYNLRVGYHGKQLLIALNDAIIYNQESVVMSDDIVSQRGQTGIFKWFGAPATVTINNFKVEGVGTMDKPSNVVEYRQDYEAQDYVPNWENNAASIETTDTGNRVLKIASGKARVVDLDSPDIKEGTLSLRYKAVAPAGQTPKQFGFRFGVNDGKFRELNWDGGQWVVESQSGYPGIEMSKPVNGTWNDLMINFKEGSIDVYLNKELVGNFKLSVLDNGVAGKFGIRTWGATSVLIDDVIYTNQNIQPEEILKYENDFQDSIAGTWSMGTPSIVTEGQNKALALENLNGISVLEDSVKLSQGTFALKVKTAAAELGIKTGSGLVKYNGSGWDFILNEKTYPMTGDAASLKLKVWNDVAVSFTGDAVTLSVNGKKSKAEIPAGVSIESDFPGIDGNGTVYLDDINYTEQFINISTTPIDKMYYEEYFETIADVDWSGLDGDKIENGRLSGTVTAKTAALNNAITVPDNGLFQVKMQADKLNSGITIGNLSIYNTSATEWTVEAADAKMVIGKSSPIEANKDYIINAEIIKGILSLKINNQMVGTADVSELYNKSVGGIGIYNPNDSSMKVKIDAMAAEEILIYYEDFGQDYIPNWTSNLAISEANKVIHNAEDGTLTVKVPGVSRFLNLDAFLMKDFHASFDFTPSVDDGISTGGRYGFVFRDNDFEGGLSVEVDVNGNWRVNVNDSSKEFGKAFSLKKGESYKVEVDVIGTTVQLKFTDKESVITDMGTVTLSSIPENAGLFGIKSWYGSKEMTFSNFEMVEVPSLPLFNLDEKTVELKKDDLTVKIDEEFPRIISYDLNHKSMIGQETQVNTMIINGEKLSPSVIGNKVDESTYEYNLNFAEKNVTMKAVFKASSNNVVEFNITEIKENGDYKVRTVSLGENSWAYADDRMTDASYAWTKSNGEWHGISEELVDHMSDMEKAGVEGTTMAMISGNGLAASIENNVMSGGNKVILEKTKKALVKKSQIRNSEWTYRHISMEETEELPWAKIAITEDNNSDQVVNWQDAAVAHRKYILKEVFGAKDMANNMMYIAFNFASQANDTFLNTLDTGKVLYNYMDGFGQMVLHKGYQAEGHDDDIPSYSNIGVRQGGVKDLKYLINEGDKYNMGIGVHLNATEYQMDANELTYDNLYGATAAGYKSDKLSKNWDWIDTAYLVDQTKDITTGQLKSHLKGLADLTRTGDKGLDFYYVDVYTGNDYNAYKLLKYANDLGIKVGTEFSGPIEPGVAFTHWGPDLGYPNKGNKSVLSRMVKNNLDIFVGNALYKGQKIPVVDTWGDSKTDIQQGVEVFYNEVLPTKYMQHFGVLKPETDQITFEEGVTSTRNKETKMIELRKDGKLISSWKDTGTTTDEGERHAGEANSLIPWTWDMKTGDPLEVNNGAKLYHWSTTGAASTWELTDEFKDTAAFDLYETTQQGKVKIATIPNDGGTITISQAKKNTSYVLYPSASSNLITAAGNWGEGSPAKDFAFNSEKFADKGGTWKMDGDAEFAIVPGRPSYSISKEMSENRLNRFIQFKTEGGKLSQTLTELEPGQDYTVGIWTEAQNGRKSSIEVKIGDKTYSNYVTGKDNWHQSSFKYVNTKWQRMDVEFKVPEGVTTAELTLTAAAGTGTVSYDDVKVWKHITTEKDVNNSDYVVFEDFENTYEGWGPFEYGGGSRKIHIATDRSNENDNNPIVQAGQGKVGPVMTWVLDGENSLKLTENEKGRHIVTNESNLKLLPNTTYDLSFDYTLEDGCDYVVYVKPVSAGMDAQLAFTSHAGQKEVMLSHVATNGDKSNKETFKGTFTTGDANDYQVYIYEKNIIKNEGNYPLSDYALILDNFGVKYNLDELKENLQQLYDANKNLVEGDYTAKTWAIFKTALDKAAKALDSTGIPAMDYKNALDDLNAAISQLIKIPVDLDAAIKEAEALKAGDYSVLSYARMQKFLTAAKKVDMGDAEAVAKVTKDLKDAIAALVNIVEANKVVSEAKKIQQKDYTKQSWNTLQNAVLEVENLIKNNLDLTQAELNAAVSRIKNAQKELIKVVSAANLAKLKSYYDTYNGKDSVYTASSYMAMKQALMSIEKMLADKVNVSEKSANDMLVQVKAAEGRLVKRANFTKLKSSYNKAKALDFNKYTSTSVKAVKSLFSQIEALLANANAKQSDVDSLYSKLTKAVKGLQAKKVTSIKLNASKKTLGIKEKYSLSTTVKPSGAYPGRLSWKSSNTKVVIVDSKGRLSARKTGSATITVKTSNGKKSYCKVTVKPAPKKITLSTKTKTLKVKKTLQLNKVLTKGSAGKVTFSSSNKKVATVTSSGKVKGISKGTVKITAKTYNGKSATIKLTIRK